VRVPEAASPQLKTYLDRVVPESIRRATHVLADSEATKVDLVQLYGTPADKITVLLSGVNARFKPTDEEAMVTVRSRYSLQRPYLFSVGTLQPRKNYARVIRALSVLRKIGYDVDLVIAGGRGWLEDTIYHTIQETRMEAHVHFIGFVDETDLPALYSSAECLVFPSLYEGFGLPVVEAMACGTPVVTSNVSSLPEVAGDSALLVNPYKTGDIVDAVRRLLDDTTLRRQLIAKGQARAGLFSWDESARKLLQIYRGVL
jgi:glycosyltransferase involved in cell wall biosynthesis